MVIPQDVVVRDSGRKISGELSSEYAISLSHLLQKGYSGKYSTNLLISIDISVRIRTTSQVPPS